MREQPPTRWALFWRRVLVCTFGHRYMFVRHPDRLVMICPRCLTVHPVDALPPTRKAVHP